MGKSQRGFTLIELLVVIAILAIIMGITVLGIDPIDKMKGANDSAVQRDVGAIATAMEAYAVSHNGVYASDQATLVTAGELVKALTPPSGYSAYVIAGGTTGRVGGELKSKKYTSVGTPAWVWCSTSGKGGATADTSTCP